MAHSNRQKLRDARGGLTKNQAGKAARRARYKSNFDPQARIKELQDWERQRDEQKGVIKTTGESKKRRPSMTKSAQRRRTVVLEKTKQLVIAAERDVIRTHGSNSQEHKDLISGDWMRRHTSLIMTLKSRIAA